MKRTRSGKVISPNYIITFAVPSDAQVALPLLQSYEPSAREGAEGTVTSERPLDMLMAKLVANCALTFSKGY